MTPSRAGAIVAIAFAAGLTLRLVRLDVRPMHHDEANQALKFCALLERGDYAYDARDHHGPTLYYLTLPVAWLRGQATAGSLDEWTLRLVPAAFGATTILLLVLLQAGIGRTAVAAAALFAALSPAMVFYSRMYIQESMFAGFTLAFAIALGYAVTEEGWRWPILAGVAAGLSAATKETAILALPAEAGACALAWWSLGSRRSELHAAHASWRKTAGGAAIAAGIAALFYSSFFVHPGSIFEPFRAAAIYSERGVAAGEHAQQWSYYVGLLAWSSAGGLTWTESVVLLFAAAGAVAAWSPFNRSRPASAFWQRYLAAAALLTLTIFSAIPYKTPWNLVPSYVLTIVVAGTGVAAVATAMASRPARFLLSAVLAIGCAHLAWQAWRASVVYASDPRNPYVYAQTVPDAVRMADRIRGLGALHAEHERMPVTVIAPPDEQWPLPWYLRTMTHVGYWVDTRDAPDLHAPVIVSSMDHAEMLDATLGDRYISGYFGLRPDVLLALYVERGLWQRYLSRAVSGLGQTAATTPDETQSTITARSFRIPPAARHARRHSANAAFAGHDGE